MENEHPKRQTLPSEEGHSVIVETAGGGELSLQAKADDASLTAADCSPVSAPLVSESEGVSAREAAASTLQKTEHENVDGLPLPARRSARAASQVELPRLNSLVDTLGLPIARESRILVDPMTCALYTFVLIGLCVANVYYLGSNSDYTWFEWWQQVRLLYEVGVASTAQQVQFALCALTSGIILCGGVNGVRTYGRHKGVLLALCPFFLLAFIPLTELLNATINNNISCIDTIRILLSEQTSKGTLFSGMGRGSGPAFVFCGTAALCMILKAIWRPVKRLRVLDDGLLVSMQAWVGFLGERPVYWQDISQAEIQQPAEGSKKQPLVRFHLKGGSTLELTWKELSAAGDPGDLFAKLKTAVPGAVPDDILGVERKADQADSYTELWLKYFSTGSKRERTGRLESGAVLGGKYAVAGELGAGGQGTAYLATPLEQGSEHVVLKEYIMPLHRGEALFQQSMKKLEHETEILQRINHPQIVKMIDHFVEDHRGYIVLEYVEGKPLKQIVQLQGKQGERVVVDLAIQICDILTYLHSLVPPVVHRDLTPDNLILHEDGTVKLVDFNVAQQLESAATATVVGKHAFIPPEQFRGKPCPQSDIYAFGGTLFHLLTGHDPEPLSVSRPRTTESTLSEELDRIVAKSTALDCNKRYATADEMKADLVALRDTTP